MLTYHNSGFADYAKNPVRIYPRKGWEFQACLTGAIVATMSEPEPAEVLRGNALWVFPAGLAHGWRGQGNSERVVFHHTIVPDELIRRVPARGYYRVGLEADDAERIRALAVIARDVVSHPTELAPLKTRAIVTELSLLALKEVKARPLSSRSQAYERTERAVAWYREHMAEAPGFEAIAQAVYVSPAHLRRLFQQSRSESPQQVFQRMRMEVATDLLAEGQHDLTQAAELTGFSCPSALSRAIKNYYGKSPRALRRG